MKRNLVKLAVLALLVSGGMGCVKRARVEWPVPMLAERPTVQFLNPEHPQQILEADVCFDDPNFELIAAYTLFLETELAKAHATILEVNALR